MIGLSVLFQFESDVITTDNVRFVKHSFEPTVD